MSELRNVTPTFAVAGQISVADLEAAAAAGFKVVIKNRPEQEEPGQPGEADLRAAAEAAGMRYHALPFTGPPPPGVVSSMAGLLEQARGPVLAYCRTGRRSIMAWAMAEALAGNRRPDEIIALAAKAGYDLSGALDALVTLAPKP